MIAAGTVLQGRYEVTRLIAHGGMSAVYAAHDRSLDRQVAIKVVRGTTVGQRQRLEREARLLAGFEHPNLVRIYDAQHRDDEAYVVLEYVDGRTLSEVIRDGAIAPATVARIGTEVAEALAYVHERGVIHRDVKPSNIFVGTDRRIRLSDFGIARHEDDAQLTQTGLVIGTGAYMAPEQAQATDVGPSADVYSLGLVLVECLTGHPAFTGTAAEAALARLTRDPDLSATPASWRPLLSDMTARDAASRPDASTCAARLRGLPSSTTTDGDTAVLPLATMPATAARSRPWRTVVLAATITVIVGLLALLVWARNGDEGAATDTTTTTVTTIASSTTSTTTKPTTTTSRCAQLRAQRDAVDEQAKSLDDQLKGRALRDAKAELDKQRTAIDNALKSC